MPNGFLERLRKSFGGIREAIRKRVGLARKIRIYSYIVRVSGYVLPPKESRKKTKYSRKTVIQFELSFEETPYFRTITGDYKLVKDKYEDELRSLVMEQERTIAEDFAITPTEEIDPKQFNVPQSVILKFLRVASKKAEDEFRTRGVIKVVAGKPLMNVDAVDFEPMGFFDIDQERIREGLSTDIFNLKLYRPNEEEEYWHKEGKFTHDL